MIGFAVMDAREGSPLAVWHTGRTRATMANHTNAVVISDDDPDATKKLDSLCFDRIVVLTPGSRSDRGHLDLADLEVIREATVARFQEITEAITAHARRSRNSKLKYPTLPDAPTLDEPSADESHYRALASADYLSRLWSDWLSVEDMRLTRTLSPKGVTPWMMPQHLNDPEIQALPAQLLQKVGLL